MRFSSLIMGIVIMAFFAVGSYTILGSLATSDEGYGVTINDSYKSTFDNIALIKNTTSNSYGEIQNASASKVETLGFVTLTVDAMRVIKNIAFLPFNVLGDIIESLDDDFLIPRWIIDYGMATLTIILLFSIAALFMRYKYV